MRKTRSFAPYSRKTDTAMLWLDENPAWVQQYDAIKMAYMRAIDAMSKNDSTTAIDHLRTAAALCQQQAKVAYNESTQ